MLATFISYRTGEAACYDHENERFTYLSPRAHEHTGWQVFDKSLGHQQILPPEAFGMDGNGAPVVYGKPTKSR